MPHKPVGSLKKERNDFSLHLSVIQQMLQNAVEHQFIILVHMY